MHGYVMSSTYDIMSKNLINWKRPWESRTLSRINMQNKATLRKNYLIPYILFSTSVSYL